ncbi:MAG: tetratricopeptide repeat protein [Bacteroidota bacterium]
MTFPIRLLYLLLLFPVLISAQTPEQIDSVAQLLEQTTDPEKIVELSSLLWVAYIDRDIDLALDQATRIIDLGEQLQVDTILGRGYQQKGVVYAYKGNFDSSGIYFHKAIRVLKKENNYPGIASAQRNLGQDFQMRGMLDSAATYYQQALSNFTLASDSIGMADMYNSAAVLYYSKGYYNIAFDKAVEGEKIFLQSSLHTAELNQNRLVIASIYSAMKDTLNAIDYLRKTTDYFKSRGLKRQYVSNGFLLANLLIPNYRDYPELDSLTTELILESQFLQDPAMINNAGLSAALLAYEKGDYQAAKTIQTELVLNSEINEQKVEQASSKLALGKTLLAMGDYPTAIEQLKQAEVLSYDLQLETTTRNALKLLAKAYEKNGDYRTALGYFKQYKILEEKIYDQEKVNRFSELQTIHETEKKENAIALQAAEIKTLNAQAKADRLTKTLYAAGMLLFLLLAGLIYFVFKQRIKKSEQERQQQEAMYKQELAFKKKELTSQTLHLVQKNTFLQEIKTKMEEIKTSPDLFKIEFRKIVSMLHRQSAEDQTWEVFKSYFSEVHNDFDVNLKALAPEVTENDIRLASFLRMNLTTKEIASLLNVLPDSVLKSKYRLKKKLGLSKEQTLNDYLNSIS